MTYGTKNFDLIWSEYQLRLVWFGVFFVLYTCIMHTYSTPIPHTWIAISYSQISADSGLPTVVQQTACRRLHLVMIIMSDKMM